MEPDEEGGVALTFEPLLAIAGGVIGGVAMTGALLLVSGFVMKRNAARYECRAR